MPRLHHPTARLARAAAGIAGALLCVLATTASPAQAHNNTKPVTVTLDCVIAGTDGTYRAVFGYDSPTTKYTIPAGTSNFLYPKALNGIQPTKFEIGAHRGAFTTSAIPNDQQVYWIVYTSSAHPTSYAIASATSKACAPPVSLPADGNGAGPAIVVAVSVVVVFLMLALRRRTPARASASTDS